MVREGLEKIRKGFKVLGKGRKGRKEVRKVEIGYEIIKK